MKMHSPEQYSPHRSCCSAKPPFLFPALGFCCFCRCFRQKVSSSESSESSSSSDVFCCSFTPLNVCFVCFVSFFCDDAVFERFFNNTTPVCPPFDAFSQEFLIAKIAKKQKKADFTCSCFLQILRDKTHVKSDDEGIDAVIIIIIIINLLFDIVVAIVSF